MGLPESRTKAKAGLEGRDSEVSADEVPKGRPQFPGETAANNGVSEPSQAGASVGTIFF